MSFLPLTLGIARAPAPRGSGKNTNKNTGGTGNTGSAFSVPKKIPVELKNRVFERDGFACRYCGFHSKKYQEIHYLNHDKADHSFGNLVTACIFCQQCFNLDDVSAMKSGMLVWLPEIEQAQLHHMARAIYVARISQGPMADAARKALDALMARREEAKNRISTDNPYILSLVLKDYLSPAQYEARERKLKGVRLLPLDRRIIKEAELEFNQFPQILAYWRSKDGPFGGKTPQQWISIYKEITKAA